MNEQEVIERLRAAVEAAGGLRSFGRAHDFSAAYISDVLRGQRKPADRILSVLGLERVVTSCVAYREKE